MATKTKKRSHSRSSNGSRMNKLQKFLLENKKNLLAVVLAVVVLIILVIAIMMEGGTPEILQGGGIYGV